MLLYTKSKAAQSELIGDDQPKYFLDMASLSDHFILTEVLKQNVVGRRTIEIKSDIS